MSVDDSGFEDMMEAAGFSPNPRQNGSGLIVRFFLKPQKNERRSIEEKRPVYEDTEFIEIRIPGDRDNVVRPASEEDKARFSQQYEAFRAGKDQKILNGMPLKEWSLVTASMVEELAYFQIHTVEQLAGVPDAMMSRIGPLMNLKQKAKDWLEAYKSDAAIVELREDNKSLRAKVESLERMLTEASREMKATRPDAVVHVAPQPSTAEIVAAVMAAMKAQEPPKPRRGRPPKNPNGVKEG